jgi:hypothetical protein
MTEVEALKAQLVAVLSLSNEAEAAEGWIERKQALEAMQSAIQGADILRHYAADLMVLESEA